MISDTKENEYKALTKIWKDLVGATYFFTYETK